MVLPDFKYEKDLWEKGLFTICGIDEVGRGCLAGPVVAGAVVFRQGATLSRAPTINDSKKLNQKQRETASKWILENALAHGIGTGSVDLINRIGIVGATNHAFREAIQSTKDLLNVNIDHLLIDAFYIPEVPDLDKSKQSAIIKGDTKSISIAAASIIAKVFRDDLMTNLATEKEFNGFGWERNKGYGTKEHREALKSLGKTKHHRTLFVSALF